jgi:GDP-D-mannose dehydratase
LGHSYGTTTKVREFVRYEFLAEAGIELEFKGEGENESAIVTKCTNPETSSRRSNKGRFALF